MSIIPFFEFFQPELSKIENALQNIIEKDTSVFSGLAQRAINSGGKRIRPMIFLIAQKLVRGKIVKDSEYAACCFELLHCASLLHDDVIDEASSRRGKPTINAEIGDKTSILLGDYLFLHAFLNILRPEFRILMPLMLETLEKMIEGEGLELEHRGNFNLSEDECSQINELKTAVLFENACKGGAILSEATDEQINAATNFGRNLGCAFQLVDDVLDYIGDQKELGKPILNDFKEGKTTIPLVITLQHATESEKSFIQEQFAISSEKAIQSDRILEIMRHYDVFDKVLTNAKSLATDSIAEIQIFKGNENVKYLEQLTNFIITRNL
ncbi:MAG: polyprenyl synthetase family protein [Planctomycetes bacterium]|nr:polyprenyl synthetase family protein [Planctomycetota bacterium]